MRRINDRSVELTEAECVIKEGYDRCMDRGYCPACAVKIILGVDIEEGVRSPAPTTDELLVGEFLEYLLDGADTGTGSCHTGPAEGWSTTEYLLQIRGHNLVLRHTTCNTRMGLVQVGTTVLLDSVLAAVTQHRCPS